MSWWDNLLSSSLVAWLIIIFLILNIYLKKTGKTLPELIRDIKDAIAALFGQAEETISAPQYPLK